MANTPNNPKSQTIQDITPAANQAGADITVTVPADEAIPELGSAAPKAKEVRVLGVDNHETHIGGRNYLIIDKQEQMVPEDVAMILQNAKVAIRVGK